MIGLLGATGYTGKLTAAALRDAGIPHRLGGRSAERLAALPSSPLAETHVVDATVPAELDTFMDGLDAVISCVGPFGWYGRPVVEAAVRTRTPYVDSTGETGFMAWVYETHRHAAVPLVPACGFDYVPGDLAVAVAAAKVGGAVTDVLVGYAIDVVPSRGTARSAVEAIAGATWRPEAVDLRFGSGTRAGVVVPWGEELTVPFHLPGVRVRSAVAAPSLVARGLGMVGGVVARSGPLVRAVKPLLAKAADRMPEGASDERRASSTFTVLAEVTGRDGARARVEVTGRDVYGLTADLLVACATRVGKAPAGAQVPATAFDPEAVLDAVPLSWRHLP